MLTLTAVPAGRLNRSKDMVKSEYRVTIKRYANRRLYDTCSARYVTVDQIAAMVDGDRDVVVYDAVTSADITDLILAKHSLH